MGDETRSEEVGVAYLVVNAAPWAVWAATGAGYPRPAWVTGG